MRYNVNILRNKDKSFWRRERDSVNTTNVLTAKHLTLLAMPTNQFHFCCFPVCFKNSIYGILKFEIMLMNSLFCLCFQKLTNIY